MILKESFSFVHSAFIQIQTVANLSLMCVSTKYNVKFNM